MGFNAKDFQVCLWKVVKFSMNTCYVCVKKHPIFSSILLVFFLLYMFLPSVFYFLIYSSPLFVIAVVTHKVLLSNVCKSIENVKGNEKKNDGLSSQNLGFVEDDLVGDTNQSSSAARRRNVEEKSREDYPHTSVEDKKAVFSTRINDQYIDKSAMEEENPREIREVNVASISGNADCSSSNADKRSQKNSGGGEIDRGSSEDTDDEEESREDRHKVVEWTEDDQKNLVDVGISEIERNKRLESLISRRRARKLLSLQVRKTLMDMGNNDAPSQIASILIPRNNLLLPNNFGSQFSPTPGSAPSVLLPMHNPFDLPYDPYEEKPNLTGDSFHQEFMEAHHKDMMYCRHESFSLGACLPREYKQDQHKRLPYHDFATKQRSSERNKSNRIGNPLGGAMLSGGSAHDNVKQDEQASEKVVDLVDIGPIEDKSEVQTRQMLVKDFHGGSSSSPSSEENETIFCKNKDAILGSLIHSAPKNICVDRGDNSQISNLLYNSGPSVFNETRPEERFSYRGIHHTPNRSIASDMQVEVSESGSPPLTVDGNISSPDEESLSIHNDDVETDSFGSEEMWPVVSSHLSGVDEIQSRSREVQEVNEQDIFSRMTHKPNPNASQILLEKVIEQESVDSRSISPSRNESPEGIEAHSDIFDAKVHDEIRPPNAYKSLDALSCENVSFPVLEKAQQSTETLVAHPSHEVDSEKAEFASDLPNISEETHSNYTEHTKGNNKNPSEDHAILESCKLNEGKGNSKSLGGYDAQVEKLVQHKDIAEKLKQIDNNSIGESVQDRVDEQDFAEVRVSQSLNSPAATAVLPELAVEQILTASSSSSSPKSVLNEKVVVDQASSSSIDQESVHNRGDDNIAEVEVSGVCQSSSDPIALITVPELPVEQALITSTSTSSPKSVLQPKFSMDQESLSNFDQGAHVDVQQSHNEMVNNNSFNELSPENLTPAAHLIELRLTEDSTSHLYHNRGFENLLEAYRPSTMYPEEVNVVSEPVMHANKVKEKLKYNEDIEGDSQLFSSVETSAELSIPSEKSRSVNDTEDMYEKLSIPTGGFKSANQRDNSMTPLPKKEEPSHPPPRAALEPSESGAIANSRSVEDVEGRSIDGTQIETKMDLTQEVGEDSSLKIPKT